MKVDEVKTYNYNGCATSNSHTHLQTLIHTRYSLQVVVYEDALIPASGSATAAAKSTNGAFESASKKNFDATVFLARIFQFCACLPYLRKALFPIHRDLQFAGMINLESPHHTRIDDPIAFREGVTLEATRKDGTLVDCSIPISIPAFIKDKAIKPGVCITIKLSNFLQLKSVLRTRHGCEPESPTRNYLRLLGLQCLPPWKYLSLNRKFISKHKHLATPTTKKKG
ncbi:hypothetical protein HDU77_011525 [Chytriomyces hyalinus]|nr:hypothetical protein HDU77_011525 [Chytriomyces hyalinus]